MWRSPTQVVSSLIRALGVVVEALVPALSGEMANTVDGPLEPVLSDESGWWLLSVLAVMMYRPSDCE